MKTKSPYIYIYIYIYIVAFSVINILPFGSLTAATIPDESPCNKHYETAIKFTVDTPVVHPFTISNDVTTGKIGKIIFSSGNLQYCPSYQHIIQTPTGQRCETITDFFRFAPRQIDRVCDGRETDNCNGNVWYDTVIKANVPSVLGGDSFYYEKRKCTNCKDVVLCVPNGITSKYHGWIDLMTCGSSCQGRRANDPYTYQFKPYEHSITSTGNAANTYGLGPSYYAPTATDKPANWIVGNINRNNIDTNSGLSRYFDWGYANIIREYKPCTQMVNGTPIHTIDSTVHSMGTWRTLTSAEWTYLMNTRKVEDVVGNTWTCCSVEDTTIKTTDNTRYIAGMLLYPDDYNSTLVDVPKLTRKNYSTGTKSDVPHDNKISAADFEKYIAAGCVFLPSARWIDPSLDVFNGTASNALHCHYWSSTAVSVTNVSFFSYYIDAVGTLNPARELERTYRFTVRLVHDL